jgi:hypothetical protein
MKRGAVIKTIVVLVGIVIGLIIILAIAGQHMYLFTRVDQQEVGVRFRGGKIYQIVGPGVYSDVAIYARLEKVSSEGVPFAVEDPEVITSDSQRIGLLVSGDVFRPDDAQKTRLQELWPDYREIYLSDAALLDRIERITKQAMKSCVGDRTFNDNVIGSSRDELRICIDEQLSTLAEEYGLDVRNVAVPNIILSADVQASLDAITKSRLDTELAQQDAIKAKEQAAADQAREEGAIRVQLAKQQEEVRQKTILAELEEERLQAQRAVIEAEKSNDLLSAQKDLQINIARADAAAEAARAELAQELALAELYGQNPEYVYLQTVLANASALNATDKIIFTPEGTTPTIVLPGPGIMPVVGTTPEPE